MGAHLRNHERPIHITLTASPWRETGVASPLNKGGVFSLFQNEEAIVRGWFDRDVIVTHTVDHATVNILPKPIIVGGLDGSRRSIQRFLNAKRQSNIRGVDIWFTPTETDTWHITSEE